MLQALITGISGEVGTGLIKKLHSQSFKINPTGNGWPASILLSGKYGLNAKTFVS